MADRVRISLGLLACFCTNEEYGHLKVVDGKVVVNKPRAFNEARRALHAGANTIRVLRHAPWANPVRFDYDCPGFWAVMREWLGILHQPYQKAGGGQGADIVLELFDGCGRVGAPGQTTLDKEWMYADHTRAYKVITQAFENLGDLPYVLFGCGNEMNQAATVDFHRKVLFPSFKAVGRIPFSYGAVYSDDDDYLEVVKKHAENFWEDRDKRIFRQIHKIRDSSSDHFKWFVENWMTHPIRTYLSGDGVKPRPTGAEFASVLQPLSPIEFQNPADTKVKYCVERMGGEDAAAAILEASKAYQARFGIYPKNLGLYPLDWAEPTPPAPPEPPEPPAPPTPPPPEPHKSFWQKLWEWIKNLFR